MTTKIKRLFTLAALISFLPALFSCGKKKDDGKKATEPKFTVNVLELAPQTLEDYIEFGGSVKAVDSVAVLPTVSGKIASILVSGGDKVKRGQVIAQIDPSKPGAEFSLSPVKATFSGTITSIPLSVGAYATSSSAIAEISSTDDLEINVNASERFVPFVKKGQLAQVTFKSYPNEFFEANVARVSPILDPATRTMEVNLKLSDTKDIVKAGMFARVKLITQTKTDVIAVPNRSIVLNGGKTYVFVATSIGENASVKRQPVTVGLSVDGKTEITQGLSKGDLLVVKGQNMLSDGQSVNALNF